jgi:hypothetical protein
MPESRFPPIAILLVLIAAFAIYGIILVPGVTFAGMDFVNLVYPRALLTREAFLAGKIPLWNWHEWGGAPLLATLLGAVLYPPTWLALLFPLPYGLQLFVFAHLVAGGSGAFLVARRIFRLPAMPAAFAGVVYCGSAFFTGRIEQFQVIAVNCLLPWLLLTLWSAAYRKSGSRWLPLVWAFTLLAGHPQFAALNLLGAGAFVIIAGLVSLVLRPRSPRAYSYLLRPAARVSWDLLLGTALAAAQLLPTWELGRLSERIWPYPQPTAPELAWQNLPALLIPGYYNITTGQQGRVIGFTELGMYAGVLTFPLALAGLVWVFRHPHRRTSSRLKCLFIAAGLIWLLAMWFALGSHGGLAGLIFEYAPFFKQSRGAARSLNVAALMLALLSATGLSVVVSGLKLKSARPRTADQAKGSALPRRRWLHAGILAPLLVVATTADLAINHHASLKSVLIPTAVLSARPIMPADLAAELQQSGASIYRFMAFDSDLHLNDSAAAVAERFARLQPNLGSIFKLNITDGYEEGLLPTRARANLSRRYNRNLRGPSPDPALLAAMGANVMLTEYPLTPDPAQWTPLSPGYSRPPVAPSMDPSVPAVYTWWRSPYPAAQFFSADVLAGGTAQLPAFLARAAADFPILASHRRATAVKYADHVYSGIPPSRFASAAKSIRPAIPPQWNRISAEVTIPTSTLLLSLPPYPGWKVSEKNLFQTKIKPLNALCYMIKYPNQMLAPHMLDLSFSPFSFRLGLFISLVAVVLFSCKSWRSTAEHKDLPHK